MIRLSGYVKPFLGIVITAILLLFAQAIADLSLPTYTGSIVNVGIQQGGIEDAVPAAIRQSQMDRLLLFMSEDEASTVLAAFKLEDATSADQATRDAYPVIADEPVYVLQDTSAETIEALNPVMGKALLVVSGIEQASSGTGDTEGMSSINMPDNMTLDLSSLPEGVDAFTVLQNLPQIVRDPILLQINERMASMPDTLIVQAAVSAVKSEYEALGMDTNSLQTNYVVRTGLTMLAISLFSGVCTITVGYLAAKTAAGMARNLRRDLFTKVEGFSHHEFNKFSVSSLITRTTNDITQLQMLMVMLIRIAFYAPIMGVGGIIMALNTDANMWWTIAVAVAALLTLIIVMFSLVLPKFRIIQTLTDRLNLVARENLSGMMVIRAFNTQSFEESRFDKANIDLTNNNLFVSRAMAAMMPMMMLIMNLASILIIWVGSHQVAESTMQVGDMIAFMQYAMQVVMSFLMMSIMFIMLPRAAVSADRIADVMETEAIIKDPAKPVQFPKPFDASVEFRNVSFRYPGAEEDVLHDLNFIAKPGETTAIIGSTGSGKSTLVNLLPRFYDVTEGEVLISGVDIRDVTQHDLRAKLGFNPQKAVLFSGTIDSNLRYADENASESELADATRIAQANEFINEKPEGLETEIAQGGSNVSGGQRQRLAIARSLVKNPPIYIFDDSFSALDYKTDSALRRALRERTQNSTVIVISQRVSTIKHAEQIVVLDEGRIVGKGTHDELMETCEVYREIAQSQLSMEELAS
ncbi:MAG: ABC transporter ATP-binding protein [Anaerolineaceae bacterium]|nr:ABC transporter ATP-binding protein [Anaerolineaceae bacterium]